MKLARLQFLVAVLALFVFGALVAVLMGASFSWGRLVLGCLIVLSAQLAVNYGNDYFDVDADQPQGATFISGGSSVLLLHPELRPTVKWIVTGLTVFSLALGIVFVLVYDQPWRYLGFVVLGNLLGWMYSAPPFRLAYRGIGELSFNFVVMFLVPSMGYLTQRGALDPAGIALLVPLLLYGFVFILSVEIPDVEVDLRADKQTWVARTGRRPGFTAIGWLALAATGWFFLLAYQKPPPVPMDFRAAGLLSLVPLVPGLWGWVRRPEDRQSATRIATSIVLSLAIFAALLDVYLAWLIWG